MDHQQKTAGTLGENDASFSVIPSLGHRACIVLPTYNEKENIERLIEALEKVFRKIPDWDMKILVVDDSSPDGTGRIVKNLQANYHNLFLLEGEKRGLGEAYRRGFTHALRHFHPDFIFQMDSDFQHNPHEIPHFLKAAEKGYDFIIGSRYIPGGDCPNWEFKRKIYSWLANGIARAIAGIRGINDCTSGYRCISGSFLQNLELRAIRSNGYAFQLSLLHAATRKKLRILEIPILFPSRKQGTSKLGKRDMFDFFFTAIKLRFKHYR